MSKRVLLGMLIAVLLASAPGLSSPPRPARPPGKAMVSRTPRVEALLASGRLEILEQYGEPAGGGAILLVRGADEDLSDAETSSGRSRGLRRVADKIFLRARAIDTAEPQKAPPLAAGRRGRLEMIQFHGPVKKEWLGRLRAAGGARPIAYVPDNAYIAWVEEPSAIESAGLPLQWREEFSTLDRLSPDLTSGPDPIDVSVQVARAGDHDAVLDEIRSRALAVLMEARDVGAVTNIRVTLPPGVVEEIATRPEVMWIEPFERPVTHDERSDLICAGLISNSKPLGPGYLSWLESRGLGDLSSTIIDVTDTGIDTGGTQVVHPGLRGRVAYSVDATGEGRRDDCAGHGTNVAGIIAGGAPDDPILLDGEGYMLGLGVAPTVRLGATRIFLCPGTFSPAVPFTDLVSGAYERGARIGNNSWGGTGTHYNSVDAEYDALTRDANRDPSDGDQGYLCVFSTGNNGPSLVTVTWPSTAKNVLSVGGTENYRPSGVDGCGTGAGLADNVDHVLSIASRGPTADGRIKPDLVAPGSHIQSLASGAPGFRGNGVCDRYYPPGQRLVNWSTGTSQSAAHVSGAAAIASEVYRRRYGTDPSPAMIKAMLINHAHDMGTTAQFPTNTLNRPNFQQGWGRVDVGSLVETRARVASDQQKVLTGTGETMTLEPVVAEDPNKPVIVTLVWTDAPGTPAAWAWVNDLDLVVEANGVTYLGNVFDRGLSVPGGQADYRNNVEEVVLPPGTSTLRVTVEAANIAGDGLPSIEGETDQDFALYASNARFPTSRGEVDFAQSEAVCGSRINIRLADLGLRGFGRASVAVESGGDRETVLLDETPPGAGVFSGALDVTGGASRPGDGSLQTADSLPVRAVYTEPDPLTGILVERTAAVTARCAPPVISDARVVNSGDVDATISWRTDHPADSLVQYGAGGIRSSVKSDPLPVTGHSVRLTGLTGCTSYSATVSSTDAAGFVATAPSSPLRFSTGPGSRGRRVVFRDDMEDLGSRWTHTALQAGAIDDWELGFPAASPPGGFSGTRVWGTNLDGNYSVGADAALVSPPIDLRDAVDAQLTFLHYYAIPGGLPPSSRGDGGWVEVTTDGGATWIAVDPLGGYTDLVDSDNPYLSEVSGVYAGYAQGWTLATFDLSAYSGNLVQIRFHLWQDSGESALPSSGWYIDDVEVTVQGGCHQARLRLDADQYGCSSRAMVMLSESDLNLNPAALDSARVIAASGTDQIEVVLTETAADSGEFRGALALRSTPATGSLTVSEGAVLSVTYVDQDSGDGTPATAAASALISDCTPPPAPTGVSAAADGTGTLMVTWDPVDTSVAPDLQGYRIYYDNDGPGPAYLGTGAYQGASPIQAEATVTSASLASLSPCSHHFITVTAFDRLGNESQFAPEGMAVPSGAAPCASARLTAGPASPGCRTTLAITLLDSNADPDPNTAGAATLAASGPSQAGDVIVGLVETNPASGLFSGTLQLSPVPQTGALAVAEGDRVTLRYADIDDGRGNAREATADLTVTGCVPPAISNVRITGRAGDRAVVRWDTDHPATSTVRYGFDPSLESTATDPPGTLPGTSHAITLSGLSPCTTIYYSISSTDARGNEERFPSQGAPLRFGTYREQPIDSDGFESGAPGWTHSGPRPGSDEWELGAPVPSVPGGPPSAYSGTSVWGTDLDGLYDRGGDMMLVSRPIDLTKAEAATLTFVHWFDIFTDHPPVGFDDGAFVEVSADDGKTWTYVTPQGGYPDIMAPNVYTPFGAGAYAGTSNGWVGAAFTMDAFVGKVVRIRFHFVQDVNDFNPVRAGWYIDDAALNVAVACHEGRIEMDRGSYACAGQTVRVRIFDADLDVNVASPDEATARVTSDAEPSGEILSLAETGPSTGIFEGTLSISASDAPGTLQVRQDDTLVASYDDADDGTGQPRPALATARVPDCTPPGLSDIRLVETDHASFRVEWVSSEPSDSRVLFGTDPSLGDAVIVPGLRTAHSVTVGGLQDCTHYLFTVASRDAGGNLARDDSFSGARPVQTAHLTTLIAESFEAGAPGWRHAGQGDTWEVSGSGVAATAPSGSYPRSAGGANADFVLLSPPIDLAGIAHPALTFLHNYDFATSFQGGDGGRIDAWDGSRWTTLIPDGGYPGHIDPEAGSTGTFIDGYSGRSPPGMTPARVDLSGIALGLASRGGSRTTRIRFHVFVEDGIGATGAGWTIDDVVVSGDAACHLGRLSFGADSVTCATTQAPLLLTDPDLDLDPGSADSVAVTVESSGTPQPLQIVMVEISPAGGVFTAAVPLSPQGDPGTLRAAAGDRITATYDDADDGLGAARRITTSLRAVGCAGPTISRVLMRPAGGDQYLIRWSTDRPATSEARLDPSGGTELVASDLRLVTSHQLTMRGLAPCAVYTVTLASEDADGLRSTEGGPGANLFIENSEREIIFADDMEGPDPGWTSSGVSNEWQRGAPLFGPPTAFSGGKVFGTDLTGMYDPRTDATLTSPPIDLTGVAGARLTFWHWYEIFANDPPNSMDDAAFVEVQVAGGFNPVYIEPIGGYPDTTDAESGQPLLEGTAVYAGQSFDWEKAVFDLSPFDGKVITLRFRIWNDFVELIQNGRTGAGWYLDDVEVSTSRHCYPAPSVTALSIPALDQGTGASGVTITGSGFRSGVRVSLGSGLAVTSTTVVSPTRINVDLSAELRAVPGPRDLTVVNPDGQAALLPGALRVLFSPRRADTDASGRIDGNDLAILAGAFATVEGEPGYLAVADLNGDGFVDGVDLALLAASFGVSF